MALIYTTKGDIEESLLSRTDGEFETNNEVVTFQEWRLGGEVVKRDTQMHLKQGIIGELVSN